MPLLEVFSAGRYGRGAFWNVTEDETALRPLLWLSEEDEKRLASFTFPRRRAQWLASRVMLDQLLPGAAIDYDENGKPSLRAHPDIHFSLSHSHDQIAMILDTEPTGIDIERIRDGISRIAPKFMSDAERVACAGDDAELRMHVYWCVKEAAYKAPGQKGVSLKTNIFVSPVALPAGVAQCRYAFDATQFDFRVHYEQRGEFMTAYLLND